jgi:epoxyqueuosine reductase QueG
METDRKLDIRTFARSIGADDVGFAAAEDYKSPRSPALEAIFPGTRSLVVLAFRELSSCESPSPQIAMGGRMDLMELARSVDYRVARYLESEFGARAATVPLSYPLDMNETTKGALGEVSLRHAAVAAGLGAFGHHNLVVHPRFGSRMFLGAILTDLALTSDPPVAENPCTGCDLCLKSCPGSALEEGKTDVMRCIAKSQPYGISENIRFWSAYGEANAEERKKMLRQPSYWRLIQANFIGFQYFCFNCMKSCPVGRKSA